MFRCWVCVWVYVSLGNITHTPIKVLYLKTVVSLSKHWVDTQGLLGLFLSSWYITKKCQLYISEHDWPRHDPAFLSQATGAQKTRTEGGRLLHHHFHNLQRGCFAWFPFGRYLLYFSSFSLILHTKPQTSWYWAFASVISLNISPPLCSSCLGFSYGPNSSSVLHLISASSFWTVRSFNRYKFKTSLPGFSKIQMCYQLHWIRLTTPKSSHLTSKE